MLPVALQNKTIDNDVLKYIKELQFEILKIKEEYALLIYKRFARSAERLPIDEKQQLLFTCEAETTEETEDEDQHELFEVKSYTRKKPGRKPLDPKLERRETIIDIDEDEKTCACGATLTRIGEEISEKLQIIPKGKQS